jgi:molybdate transport system regulatory protein
MPNRKSKKKNGRRDPRLGVRGRIWIEGPEGTFIGWGRVNLLEQIREQGSITKAAKSLEMAYRHAWDLVDSMNRQSRMPFVEVTAGGKGGGGARVTEEGEKAIRLFRKFAEDFKVFLEREQKKLRF